MVGDKSHDDKVKTLLIFCILSAIAEMLSGNVRS